LTQAHEGDNGHMLMTIAVLQQREIEQNDKIISLLQDIKDKK
jgi:hypothetical protein